MLAKISAEVRLTRICSTASRDWNLITYRIVGDANDFANWEKIDTKRIEFPYYDSSR